MQQKEFTWKANDGVNIYAKEWIPEGKVKGAVALVHGLGEHIGRYNHVAESFAKAGYAMVGFDLPGHGKSEGIRGYTSSNKAIMDDISENIRITKEHFPDAPVFLYGHSLGGSLGLYYCLTEKPKIKGAFITSPGLKTTNPVPTHLLILSKVLNVLAPKTQINNTLDLSGLSRDKDVVEKYKNDPLVHSLITPRMAESLFADNNYCIQHAEEFSLPLLLMVGTADIITNPKSSREFALAAPMSKVTFKEWEGFYHELHNEPEKAEVLKTMIGWLDQELH